MSLWDDHEPNPPKVKKSKLKTPHKKEKPSKSSLFTKGYSDVRKRVEKGSRFTMSCYNCDYLYQGVGDKEEVCHNPDVLKYDMTITDSSIYCNRWKLSRRTSSVKSMFKKKV